MLKLKSILLYISKDLSMQSVEASSPIMQQVLPSECCQLIVSFLRCEELSTCALSSSALSEPSQRRLLQASGTLIKRMRGFARLQAANRRDIKAYRRSGDVDLWKLAMCTHLRYQYSSSIVALYFLHNQSARLRYSDCFSVAFKAKLAEVIYREQAESTPSRLKLSRFAKWVAVNCQASEFAAMHAHIMRYSFLKRSSVRVR